MMYAYMNETTVIPNQVVRSQPIVFLMSAWAGSFPGNLSFHFPKVFRWQEQNLRILDTAWEQLWLEGLEVATPAKQQHGSGMQ